MKKLLWGAALFLWGASASHAAAETAPTFKASLHRQSGPKRIVVRLRSESATGLTPKEGSAAAGDWKNVPKALKKIHQRWGVRSLSRVRQGDGPGNGGAFARRSPRAASSSVGELRDVFRRTAVLELAPGADLDQAISDYRSNPDVEWAAPVARLYVQGIPNDPSYPSLWGMTKIQAPAAWDIATGSGVVVAVVDTGVDSTHPDLASNLWTNPGEIPGNGIDDDGNGFVDDTRGWNFVSHTNSPVDGHSHGTHVAGTIAAVGNNAKGVIGVAPGAKIMVLKGLADDGSGDDADLAQGIIYAADNGADVVNMSWGGTGDSPVLEEAIQYAHSMGVVLVAAAGNSAIDASQFLPAKYASVITVSAFNSADAMASFSNFGMKIDVAAPGVGILSTVPGGYYSSYNGTSMACPHVAGLAALLLSLHPAYTNEQVRQAIRQFSDDVGAAGFDTQSGHGRINALRTLQAGSPPTLEITSPAQYSPLAGTVDVRGSATGGALASWRLEYGAGTSPSTFSPIGPPSSGPVNSGSLGLWNVSTLAEGLYTLRLSATDGGGANYSYTVSPVRADRTAPQLLSVTPADGASIPATPLTVSALAADNYGIARVEFKLDGTIAYVSSPTAPTNSFSASFSWNAAVAGGGAHAWEVSAFDVAGNKTSRAQNITVVTDTQPPTVAITFPSPDSDVSGTVVVAATAADNVAVDQVSFSLDGAAPFATVSTPPYRASLSTVGLSLGNHALTATAVDASVGTSSHTITVKVVPDTTPPTLSNVQATVLTDDARVTWTTDEPSDARVEYGTTPALGSFSTLSAGMSLSHQADLLNLSVGTPYFYRALSRDNAGNLGISSTGTFVPSGALPPLGQITSPADGAVAAGNLSISGHSPEGTDLSRVDILLDGHYWATAYGSPPPQANIASSREKEPDPVPDMAPQSDTTAWTYTLDTTQLNDGPHVLAARFVDSGGTSDDDTHSITLQNGQRIATFDPLLGAPLCSQPGAACASGGLLEARSTVDQYPEPHHPNTVLGGCDDGSSGRYHTDESNDWIQVTSLNGGPLKAGTPARVDAKVWAYSTINNYLDLYVTASMSPPSWTFIKTLRPDKTRAQILSSTITLPISGSLQAIRAVFRYQGNAGVCSAGDYDDHDDLAFAVEKADTLPPTVSDELRLGELYARPSPVTGGEATLRVEVENADRIRQRIYSLTGQLVLENPPTSVAESLNGWQAIEARWSTEDVAAGTYYWAVEAEKEGKTVRNIRKLAVVK